MNARFVVLALTTALLAGAAGCSESAPPAPEPAHREAPFARPFGYWEGEGTWHKVDMKDAYKEMTRSAEHTFWFVLHRDGSVEGEIEIQYDAVLTVDGLVEASIPDGPIGIPFKPNVGGMITDPDPTRKYPLTGTFNGDMIHLAAVIAEDAPTIEFTLRADPGFGKGLTIMKMPMTPFTPFAAPASVTKRPQGPHVASYELHEETLDVEWNARQITTEEVRR